MSYKHSCVVDVGGAYKTIVLVLLEQRYVYRLAATENPEALAEEPTMTMEWIVQGYTLGEGERLVDTTQPTTRPYAGAAGFIRPCWDDETTAWVEGATEAEIAAWEAEHPAPATTQAAPTAEEQLRADVDFLAALEGVTL